MDDLLRWGQKRVEGAAAVIDGIFGGEEKILTFKPREGEDEPTKFKFTEPVPFDIKMGDHDPLTYKSHDNFKSRMYLGLVDDNPQREYASKTPHCLSMKVGDIIRFMHHCMEGGNEHIYSEAKRDIYCIEDPPPDAPKDKMNWYKFNQTFTENYSRPMGKSISLCFNPNDPGARKDCDIMFSYTYQSNPEEFLNTIEAMVKFKTIREIDWAFLCSFANFQCNKYSLRKGNPNLRKNLIKEGEIHLYRNDKRAPSVTDQVKDNPFKLIVPKVKKFFVVHTKSSELYQRLWCCYELAMAATQLANNPKSYSVYLVASDDYVHEVFKAMDILNRHISNLSEDQQIESSTMTMDERINKFFQPKDQEALKILRSIKTSEAQCSSEEDKKMLTKYINEMRCDNPVQGGPELRGSEVCDLIVNTLRGRLMNNIYTKGKGKNLSFNIPKDMRQIELKINEGKTRMIDRLFHVENSLDPLVGAGVETLVKSKFPQEPQKRVKVDLESGSYVFLLYSFHDPARSGGGEISEYNLWIWENMVTSMTNFGIVKIQELESIQNELSNTLKRKVALQFGFDAAYGGKLFYVWGPDLREDEGVIHQANFGKGMTAMFRKFAGYVLPTVVHPLRKVLGPWVRYGDLAGMESINLRSDLQGEKNRSSAYTARALEGIQNSLYQAQDALYHAQDAYDNSVNELVERANQQVAIIENQETRIAELEEEVRTMLTPSYTSRRVRNTSSRRVRNSTGSTPHVVNRNLAQDEPIWC